MKLGMNLLLYTTQPDEKVFPVCDRLRGFGFESLEWPLLGENADAEKKIADYNSKHRLDATAVSVFPPDACPISTDPETRKRAGLLIKTRLDQCERIGATLLCGPLVQALGVFTGKGPSADERHWCIDMLHAAGDHARSRGVTIAIEFLNRFEIFFINTAADAAKLCDEVDHPNVKMMYDSFHAHIEEKNQFQAIVGAKRHIVHFHVSENDRGVPGSGQVHWDDYFRGVKEIGRKDVRLTIESFGDALPDLAAAAKIWRPLFQHADDVPYQGASFIKKMVG
jgi:D-psicose/D-tagatose/L-ribulose 3-epimerase